MAKGKAVGQGFAVAAVVVGMARGCVRAAAFREGFRDGLRARLKRCGGTGQGVFREVRLTGTLPGVFGEDSLSGACPADARGLCAVLPGGLRIEGLDVEGAAALARLLS
ncbi:MAG: hypothetical protein WBS54_10010 [Acidobacteriota bacterium]